MAAEFSKIVERAVPGLVDCSVSFAGVDFPGRGEAE
jgi:hypothetical protein